MTKALLILISGLLGAPAAIAKQDVNGSANPELKGTWKLAAIDCADHKPATLTKESQKALQEMTSSQGFVIEDKKIIYYIDEGRIPHGYCRTSFTEKWNLENGSLLHTGIKFVKREGVHGYKCFEPYNTKVAQKDYKTGFKIQGDTLTLTHPNLVLKKAAGVSEQNCETGADLVLTYKKTK